MNVVIHTPTNNLMESLDFYQRLGFRTISKEKPTLFTDGKALVEVNPDRFARAGIKLYKQSWDKELSQLQKITPVTEYNEGYLFSDPSGVWIYLVASEAGGEYKIEDHSVSFSALGNFSGLSLETTDFQGSSAIYKVLGFTEGGGSYEQGYQSFVNNGFFISIMKSLSCPHLFFNPSMTYFNGKKNLSVIEKIRSLKIPITEEITHFNKEGIVDNIIIRDPGGYGFFVFND